MGHGEHLGIAPVKPLLGVRGIVTVLNTPFTADDAIDPDGLRANIENAVRAGVAGFLVPAMASEAGKLSAAEREDVLRTAIDAARGRVPVIGGASHEDAAERLRLARQCIDLGCEGVLASIPYRGDAQYRGDVAALAALDPPFLMLQDWDATGSGLPVPLIARLFEEFPAFRALKVEVAHAGVKYTAVMRATGGQLHLSGGWAVLQLIEALDRGVHAFMPTGMHSVYTRIFALYHAGKRDEARQLFNRLLPVIAFSNQHLDVSIHFFKRLLNRQGVYATPRVRAPILPFDAQHERIADELIEDAIALIAECDAWVSTPR